MCKFQVTLLCLMIGTGAHPATYFVSLSGNDRNTGTDSLHAWQSIAHVNTQDLNPGDRVQFKGGEQFSGTLTLDGGDDGNAASPVTISSFGTGRATISSGGNVAVYINGAQYLTIRNLICRGDGHMSAMTTTGWTGNIKSGIFIEGVNTQKNNLTLDGLEVSGYGDAEIMVFSNGVAGYTGIEILNCVVFNGNNGGILVGSWIAAATTARYHRNLTIRGCKVYDIWAQNLNKGSGILMSRVAGGLVEYCYIRNTGRFSANTNGGPVGLWMYDCDSIIVQHCESCYNYSQHVDGGGFDIDGGCRYCILQYNYSHHNKASGYFFANWDPARVHKGNVIRYNISVNDAFQTGGINIWGSINDTNYIYGNTVFASQSAGSKTCFRVESGGAKTFVYNNIFYANGLLPYGIIYGARAVLRHNAYYQTATPFLIRWGGLQYAGLADFRSATGNETVGGQPVGLDVDPKLTSPGFQDTVVDPYRLAERLGAYKLLSSSPCIGKGLDLAALYGIDMGAYDFYGSTLPQAGSYDIGAHETGGPAAAEFMRMSPVRALGAAPNPFNPVVILTVGGSSDFVGKELMLKIYDATGREVADLSNRVRNGRATWNASQLPSGLYMAKLVAGKKTDIQGLTLLR